MKSVSRIFSLIAGIISTIIGSVSVVGIAIAIFTLGFSTELIKPIILCVMFFSCGVSFLSSKGGDVSKLIALIIMIVVLILEQLVWVGSIFAFTEVALALVFKSGDLVVTFAVYYSVILYIIMACTILAMIFHIIGMALSKRKN